VRCECAESLAARCAPTAGVLVDQLQNKRVAAAARADGRLEDDRAADDLHDRERVRVAVRIDTDDVVQLICKHPRTDLQPKRWGDTSGVGLGLRPLAA
jgi:hypothetical protein